MGGWGGMLGVCVGSVWGACGEWREWVRECVQGGVSGEFVGGRNVVVVGGGVRWE